MFKEFSPTYNSLARHRYLAHRNHLLTCAGNVASGTLATSRSIMHEVLSRIHKCDYAHDAEPLNDRLNNASPVIANSFSALNFPQNRLASAIHPSALVPVPRPKP